MIEAKKKYLGIKLLGLILMITTIDWGERSVDQLPNKAFAKLKPTHVITVTKIAIVCRDLNRDEITF